GGLVIFYRENLMCSLLQIAVDTEAISVSLGNGDLRLILGYLPDGRDEIGILNMNRFIINNVSKTSPNIVVGDYNMPGINWSACKVESAQQQCFFDCMADLGLEQLVTEPTRDGNILDLILVDNERTVFDVSVAEHFGSS